MSPHLLQNPCTKVYTASNIIAPLSWDIPPRSWCFAERHPGSSVNWHCYGESTASLRNLLHVRWIFHISLSFLEDNFKDHLSSIRFPDFSLSMNHPISYCGGISLLTNRCSSLDDSRFTASITLSQTIRSCSPCICQKSCPFGKNR